MVMTDFVGTRLNDVLTIKKLYTVHYFEFSNRYFFPGESHDFWEFVYVDKGDIAVVAGERSLKLSQGNIIFHKPNEWHRHCADGVTASNIAIVSIECDDAAMQFFEDKILAVGQEQKHLISKIIAEYADAFATPLDDPYTHRLARRNQSPIAAEQLLHIYLCELLISFLRSSPLSRQHGLPYLHQSDATLNLLLGYMREKVNGHITLSELMAYSGTNKTMINHLFQKEFHMGAIAYFIRMKTEVAKKYLREANYNITQIAEMLGYSNIHYFSRQFKKTTGMTPTEYAISIRAMVEK